MKKIDIYKDDELIIPISTDNYDIFVYEKSVDITCKDGIDRTYSIPLNKGYKIVVEI